MFDVDFARLLKSWNHIDYVKNKFLSQQFFFLHIAFPYHDPAMFSLIEKEIVDVSAHNLVW